MSTISKKYNTPPRTAMEVFEMLPEGTLAEVINNVIYMSPAPSFHHQDVCTHLASLLRLHVFTQKLGKCLASPIDVFFDDKNVLQPDIIFISEENMKIVKDGKVKGAPDLVIEVLSPGNKKHHTERKKPVYEKYGVKEFFLVNPVTSEVTSYYLSDKKFVKQESRKGQLKSKLLNETFSF